MCVCVCVLCMFVCMCMRALYLCFSGNFAGVKPFLLGPPCTQCSHGDLFCDNKLCNSKHYY